LCERRWRRTKQSALVKLGMSDDTHDDEDFDKLVVTCKEQHALLKKVHAAILSHIAALKQATSSGQLVAQVRAHARLCAGVLAPEPRLRRQSRGRRSLTRVPCPRPCPRADPPASGCV
jgi:hypothetical protein